MTGGMKIRPLPFLALVLIIVGIGARADTRTDEPAEQLRAVVDGFHYAILENRVGRAMSYYHSESPQAVQMREQIEFGMSQYLQKATMIDFTVISNDEQFASARARHRILRIAGIKFLDKEVNRLYLFRHDRGTWKLWSVDSIER